ncbi:MAG: GNAT family N-acetyltransferase [Nostoc sp.]
MTASGEQNQPMQAPQPLNSTHHLEDFHSGSLQLDDWLKKRGLKNEGGGASRTYVVLVGGRVIAYYCLATGSVLSSIASGKVRRNKPDPIPVMVIGRLAVDQQWQGKGIGYALIRDAVFRTLQAAKIVGVRAILVHAISEEAKQFYEKCGFTPSPVAPLTLMVTMADAKAALGIELPL